MNREKGDGPPSDRVLEHEFAASKQLPLQRILKYPRPYRAVAMIFHADPLPPPLYSLAGRFFVFAHGHQPYLITWRFGTAVAFAGPFCQGGARG